MVRLPIGRCSQIIWTDRKTHTDFDHFPFDFLGPNSFGRNGRRAERGAYISAAEVSSFTFVLDLVGSLKI